MHHAAVVCIGADDLSAVVDPDRAEPLRRGLLKSAGTSMVM